MTVHRDILIRPLAQSDWDAWKPLWDAYLHFYRADIDAATTKAAFERLCARRDGMCGLLALEANESAVGFAHIVFHAATWTKSTYCYLEDLYVAPTARGGELSSDLISAVYEEADRAGSTRVYWHTQEFNGAARSLYDKVGHRTSFIVYVR